MFKYRGIIVKRNKGYNDLKHFPEYKNANFFISLSKKNNRLYDSFIIFIGSSIVKKFDFEKHFKNRAFLNRGVGDDTTTGVLERFDEDVIKLAPTKVVIFTSANDIKYGIAASQSSSNLEKMLQKTISNNIVPIVVIILPVIYKLNPSLNYSRPHDKLLSMEKALIMVCKKYKVKYIHLRELLESKNGLAELYLKDGIHLNEKGYELLSEIILKELEN